MEWKKRMIMIKPTNNLWRCWTRSSAPPHAPLLNASNTTQQRRATFVGVASMVVVDPKAVITCTENITKTEVWIGNGGVNSRTRWHWWRSSTIQTTHPTVSLTFYSSLDLHHPRTSTSPSYRPTRFCPLGVDGYFPLTASSLVLCVEATNLKGVTKQSQWLLDVDGNHNTQNRTSYTNLVVLPGPNQVHESLVDVDPVLRRCLH